MKKMKVLLLLALSSSLLLFGCGSKEESAGDTKETADSTSWETIPTDTKAETEESTAETETEAEEESRDGMVRSVITNEWVAEDVANTRPIAVMLPTDKVAQPQYGIANAGVLYECMEEGEMSRQLGIIEDWQSLEKIGNIRSCRDYYVYWGLEWDPIIVHFGGPFYLADLITRSDVENITGCAVDNTSAAPGANAFFRTDEHAAPHNAYTSGEKLVDAIGAQGYSFTHRPDCYSEEHFQFASEDAPNTLEDAKGSFDATAVDLSKIFTTTKSSFEYDEELGAYKKFIYGNPQIDATTNEQLTFENIIVQNTYYEVRDAKGYLAFKAIDDTRDGYFFTKGKGIHITWIKESDYSPTRYYDDDGNEIVINTGKTFIAVAQDGREVIYN